MDEMDGFLRAFLSLLFLRCVFRFLGMGGVLFNVLYLRMLLFF